MTRDHDTIAAPATASGGAIAVIRISGSGALTICDRIFRGRAPLASAAGYTVHFGRIVESDTLSPCGSICVTVPGPEADQKPLRGQGTGPDATASPSSRQNDTLDVSRRSSAPGPTGERIVDEVLATVFRAPHSYTGEDSVEISCHGSAYIVSEVLRLLNAAGARMAEPGEFTVRAYLNAKMDLSQAEAVADLIASSSKAAHTLAVNQMRGGYSTALDALRDKLLNLVSLLELELDFSEEEVEFADRTELQRTIEQIAAEIDTMRESFSLGNAIKQGVAVALVGPPNVGKSTLLNRLLNEQRALVSEIAGTTRDVIEEMVVIDGVTFRFLDTAGIRPTDDRLERMGIERTLESISRAQIVIRLCDAARYPGGGTDQTNGGSDHTDGSALPTPTDCRFAAEALHAGIPAEDSRPETPASESRPAACRPEKGSDYPDTFAHAPKGCGYSAQHASTDGESDFYVSNDILSGFTPRKDQRLLTVVNKMDTAPDIRLPDAVFGISAKTGAGIERLRQALRTAADTEALYHGDAVISNSRHYEALSAARDAIGLALESLRAGLPPDLLSEELRPVIHHLGTITGRGAITPDEVLKNIFSKFCIGK